MKTAILTATVAGRTVYVERAITKDALRPFFAYTHGDDLPLIESTGDTPDHALLRISRKVALGS